MATNGFRKEFKTCNSNNLQGTIQDLCNNYKTNIVLMPKVLDTEQSFIVEVGANLISGGILINVGYIVNNSIE